MEKSEIGPDFTRTPTMVKREKKHLKIFFEFKEMTKGDENMKMPVCWHVAKKNGVSNQQVYLVKWKYEQAFKDLGTEIPDIIRRHPEYLERYKRYAGIE